MLQVAFSDSRLNKESSVVPRVVQRETVPYEEVLAYMSKGAVVSTSDMAAVLTQFTEALVQFLAKGKRVQTPLGAFTIHVRSAGSEKAPRSVSADSLCLRIRPTTAVADELKRDLQVVVVDTPPTQTPLVYSITNVEDEDGLDGGRPGEILHLVGSRLSFDPKDPHQGVFFVAEDGVVTRARAYSRVGSRLIDCKIPIVPPGRYNLEVRSQPAKVLRSGSYKSQITVTSAT